MIGGVWAVLLEIGEVRTSPISADNVVTLHFDCCSPSYESFYTTKRCTERLAS